MSDLLGLLTLLTAVITAIITLFVGIYIPRRIMVNQLYANLIADYRSPQIGAAILALFHFYVEECKEDITAIDAKYKEKYEEQIRKYLESGEKADFFNTLHFQRRLVAQFYFNLATLRFDRCCLNKISKKDIKRWFTQNETKLLSIILHLAKPARDVFIEAGDIPDPPQGEVYMNDLLYKLYKEAKKLK